MIKYKVYTNDGFVEFSDLIKAQTYHLEFGIGDIETIEFSLHRWDKAAYCDAINEAHNNLFQQLYTERDYLTIGEIPIWQNDEEFGDESLALQNWWIDTCKIVENYLSTVTEATIIDNFIDTLPKLNLNG
jgi:hypothetical protein